MHNKSLKLWRPRNYGYVSQDAALESAERYAPRNEQVVEAEGGLESAVGGDAPLIDVSQAGDFRIERLPGRFRMCNVMYCGEPHVVEMSDELLDDGNGHTQEEWVDLTQGAELRLADSQLYTAVIMGLCANQDNPDVDQKGLVGEVRQLLAKDFRDSYLMTSSRVCYKKRGKDFVIHDGKYSTARRVMEDIVGEANYINPQCGFEDAIEALLGTRDLAQVENACKWVSGQNPYLFRVNSPPDNDFKKAVVLGVNNYSNWFVIDAVDGIVNDRPARGWSARPMKNA